MPMCIEKNVYVEAEVSDAEILKEAERNPSMAKTLAAGLVKFMPATPAEPSDVESDVLLLIESLCGSRVTLRADGSEWLCRAWFGSRIVEGRHRRRVSAAALCLANVAAL